MATAFATEGSNNQAAALAVGNSKGTAEALGTGNEASAVALGGAAPTLADSTALGTGADVDTYAQGAGSLTGASATATQTLTNSPVMAASGLTRCCEHRVDRASRGERDGPPDRYPKQKTENKLMQSTMVVIEVDDFPRLSVTVSFIV